MKKFIVKAIEEIHDRGPSLGEGFEPVGYTVINVDASLAYIVCRCQDYETATFIAAALNEQWERQESLRRANEP